MPRIVEAQGTNAPLLSLAADPSPGSVDVPFVEGATVLGTEHKLWDLRPPVAQALLAAL
jgi:hypothetical protein